MACCCGPKTCCDLSSCVITFTVFGIQHSFSASSQTYGIYRSSSLESLCPPGIRIGGSVFIEAWALCCTNAVSPRFAGIECLESYCGGGFTDYKSYLSIAVGFYSESCGARWIYELQCNESGVGGQYVAVPVCAKINVPSPPVDPPLDCNERSCETHLYRNAATPTISISCNPLP